VDLSFVTGTSVDEGEVRAIAVQSDGKILIGGVFTEYQGLSRLGLVRVHSEGLVDLDFQPPFENPGNPSVVNALAMDTNGGCIVGGRLFVTGVGMRYLIRLDPNGLFDTNFDQNLGFGINNYVHTIAIRSGGNIIIAGSFDLVNGSLRSGIAELNADGSLFDFQDFQGGFSNENELYDHPSFISMKVVPDGSIFICGNFTHYGTEVVDTFIKILPDGSLSLDHIVDLGTNSEECCLVLDMLPEYDGSVIIVGTFTEMNGIMANHVARILPAGEIDLAFVFDSSAVYYSWGYEIRKIMSDGDSGFVVLSNSFGNSVGKLANYDNMGNPYSDFNSSNLFSNGLEMVKDLNNNILVGTGVFPIFGIVPGILRVHGRNGPAFWQCLSAQAISLSANDTLELSNVSSTNEVWYETTLDNCMSLTLSTCSGSSIEEFGPGLYTSCPSYPDSVIALPVGTPNACGGLDYTFEELGAGTYWLAVQADSGSYSFSISNIVCGPLDCMQVPGGSALPGTACDDSNPETENDTWTSDCLCSGVPVVNTDCNGVVDGPAVPGTPCDDQILFTTNDTWVIGCICMGYDCASELGGTALPGTPCDDGLAWTYNDVWNADCDCQGVGMVGVRELNGQFPLVRIVPNPCSSGSFDLLYDASSRSIQVRLLDAASREVLSEAFTTIGGRVTVDRNGIPAGLYLVEVSADEGRTVQRVILQ